MHLAKGDLMLFLQIDKNVERELINHRSLLHPNIIRFKEVHNIIPTTESAVDVEEIPFHLLAVAASCCCFDSNCQRHIRKSAPCTNSILTLCRCFSLQHTWVL